MRQYRLLEITAQYDRYLRNFYHLHKDIDELTYDELFTMIVEDGFAESDFIHRQLNNIGVESKVIFYNNRNLQTKWHSFEKDMSYFNILLLQIKEFLPDVILISDMFAFSKKEIDCIKLSLMPKHIKLVGFHFSTLNDTFKRNAVLYDQIYTGSKEYVNIMRSYGLPVYLLRHAFEPYILERMSECEKEKAVCFSGSIIVGKSAHNNRMDMLDAMLESNVPYDFYGNIYGSIQDSDDNEKKKYLNIMSRIEKDRREGMFGIEYYSIINRYNICLNMHSSIVDTGAGNLRMYEATGIGSCLLTDCKDENSELFDVDNEIVVYQSLEDMVEKAKWLIENPNEARKIAIAGQKRTLKEHTYKNKAECLNDYIQKLLA